MTARGRRRASTKSQGVDDVEAEDGEDEGEAGRPASHHHHTSGDSHTAIPILNRDLSPLVAMNAVLIQPAGDGARPAHDGDGPEYPPRRTRTII